MYNSSNYFTGVKEGDKDRAGAASGFVSISKSGPSEAGAASADSAVVDEDAASLMSVGADSTASSAAQESGTIPHSNNKNSSSNVRESSWAMVAAASASGSGAGSAALSVASTNTNEEGGAVVVTGGDGNGAPLGDSSDFRTTLSSDSLLFISQVRILFSSFFCYAFHCGFIFW